MIAYEDGSTYSGRFLNDLPHGTGTLEYANKDLYRGNFKEGRKEGQGAYYFSEGTVF